MPTKLRNMLRWLKRRYPPPMPIVVRVTRSQPDLHGVCLVGDGRALIRISAASETVMQETLLEEYCHVLRHCCPLPVDDEHDALFWAILGAVTTEWRGE